jgi:hypothetical protein
MAPRSAAAVAESRAFGSTRPIIAALAERGDAVNDRVYKVIRQSCNLL